MRLTLAGTLSCVLLATVACGTPATPAVDVEGDWEGMVDMPGRPVLLRVHLARQEGGWEGTAEVPGAGTVPLTQIRVDPPRVEFVLPLEGGIRFDGQTEGAVVAGQVQQGESTALFRLEKEPVLPPPTDRAEAWLQDLEIAERKFLAYDRSLSDAARDEARRRLRALGASAADRSDDELIVELARIVALSGNAHTRLYLLRNRSALRRLPIRVWWFGDGLYVVRAKASAREALGRKVLAIGGHDPEAARSAVATLFAGNESWTAYKSTYFLTSPEVLHGLDLVSDPERVVLTYEGDDGRRHELELHPLPLDRQAASTEAWWDLSPGHAPGDWLVPSLPETPLFLRHPERPYWIDTLEDTGVVYVHFSRTRRAEGPELLDLVTASADQPPARALVLDLRWNTGGDNTIAKPFLEWVARSGFNAPDRLFVITGRATFSAGLYSAAWLAQHTEAVFVGEPVGDVLDYWSEGGNIQLPHSGLTVHFANGFHGYSTRSYPEREPFFEDLSVESLEPELPVSLTFADWRAGLDPALEAIAERRASKGSAIR